MSFCYITTELYVLEYVFFSILLLSCDIRKLASLTSTRKTDSTGYLR